MIQKQERRALKMIRFARESDVEAMLAIYAPYVLEFSPVIMAKLTT